MYTALLNCSYVENGQFGFCLRQAFSKRLHFYRNDCFQQRLAYGKYI